jgi:outer membrane lipoprotein-sorting protein
MKTLWAVVRYIKRGWGFVALSAAIGAPFGVLAAAQGASHAGAAPSSPAIDWLSKAMGAPVHVSYRATETLITRDSAGSRSTKVRVVHRAPDATRREYLSDGRHVERVITDDGHSRWQHLPQRRELFFSPSLRVDRELWGHESIKRLLSAYEVRTAGQTTVNGRKAHAVLVSPRSGHIGPSKRLLVDERTGLLLRSELTSSDGKIKLTSTLSDLRLEKTIPASELTPPSNAKKQTVIYEHVAVLPLPALARHWKHPLVVPKSMPLGYSLESARALRHGRHNFVHLRYFDGLNPLSIFEAPSRGASSRATRNKRGSHVGTATATWRREPPYWSLTWRERGLKLTVVGDLPREQLLQIARSMRQLPR